MRYLPATWLKPKRLLTVSVLVAVLTMALKLLAWHVTGSVSLLSDALETIVNLAGALFGLMMVRIAAIPADADHPYGHHKAEYFSAGFEGLLILGAAVGIFWTSIHRMLEPTALAHLDVGLALAVLSAILNGVLSLAMKHGAQLHRSAALEGGSVHLMADVWTSVGVVVGLAFVPLTQWIWVDPLIAMLIGLHIAREGVRLVWRAARTLMDEALEPELQATVRSVLGEFAQPNMRLDHLYTRKAGSRCFVDLHLHLPHSWTLGHAAELRRQLEKRLIEVIPGLRATIQILPNDVETYSDSEHK